MGVRALQIKIGRPTTRDMVRIFNKNLLPNNPFTVEDLYAADDILGPDIGSLKGKTTHRAPPRITNTIVPLPYEIKERYRHVTLCADIMFVNKIPFLMTTSRHIRFGTAELLTTQTDDQITKALQHVQNIYRTRGFSITLLLADGQFSSLRNQLADKNITLNDTGRDENVGDIERYIRTVKERTRCIYNTLPFHKIPCRVIIEMVYASVYWLNAFPHPLGISQTLSPRQIITGQTIDYNRHCKYEFGQYVQTHEDHDNSMHTRTVGALALRPTGNQQGNYYFFSLTTGRVLNRTHATPLPMPNEVIERVHTLARMQHMPNGMYFANGEGGIDNDDEDDDDDEDYEPNDDNDDEDPDDDYLDDDDEDGDEHANQDADYNDGHDNNHGMNNNNDGYGHNHDNVDDQHNNQGPGPVPHVNEDDQALGQNEERVEQDQNEERVEQGQNEERAEQGQNEDEQGQNEERQANVNIENAPHEQNNDDAPPELLEPSDEDSEYSDSDEDDDDFDLYDDLEDPTAVNYDEEIQKLLDDLTINANDVVSQQQQEHIDNQMDEQYGPRTSEHNLRPRKPRRTGEDRALTFSEFHAIVCTITASLTTPQVSLKKGLRQFGEHGVAAVKKEIKQLHVMKVMFPVYKHKLTAEERRRVLEYLMFLKRKSTGQIKARGCADGRKQREYISPADATSPTVSNEAVFLTAAIEAREGRAKATVDIPGAFMHADQGKDDVVHVRLTDIMVDILLQLDHAKYAPYVVIERGRRVLYVQLDKALYGTIKAAKLFYENFLGTLKKLKFETNPYDACVANKMINGKQCTIVWHVDDLKISHQDPKVIDTIISILEEEYGQHAPLTIRRGEVHDYLGMTLDYRKKGRVAVSMKGYIASIIEELPLSMRGRATTPAANHLFNVNENQTNFLNAEESDRFHRLTAKLMYLSQRARPDMRTAASFLSTRVKRPDVDDEKKLARAMKYLQATINLVMTIDARGEFLTTLWWVDASYAVHPDMKSHTGGVMSMGKGAVYATSVRQKLTTRSSTEAELVGVHDVLPQVLWTKHFLEAQGHSMKPSIIYQDNQSAMLLEKNGRASSGKRTRHVNIRYFFAHDRIQNGEIEIQYCPTEEMLADFFTKPLQGSLFLKFRNRILNIDPTDEQETESMESRSVLENKENENPEPWTLVRPKSKRGAHRVTSSGNDVAVKGTRDADDRGLQHVLRNSR
jgi:hypothetical protein